MKVYKYTDLPQAPLHIDATYEGGPGLLNEPLSKLVGCNNQGGFRYLGSVKGKLKMCVLYSSLYDPDWPDHLDVETGIFTYYGDNKVPGHELHDTYKKGNLILKMIFNDLHLNKRKSIPPIFVFTKGAKGRDVIFRGLAIPGAKGVSQLEDLIAIWKTAEDQRFQNYKATFTIIDVPVICRKWVSDIQNGNPFSNDAPESWIGWINGGKYVPLLSPRSIIYRTKIQQLPKEEYRLMVLQSIINYFKTHENREYAFEACAVAIVKMMDPNTASCDLTRPWRDGGRDALGKYRIGFEENGLLVDYALEAKCKGLGNGSGVKEISRLVSRLRYRQFGIFVTTSYVDEQAYKEILEDNHPIVIVSGNDIVEILIRNGYTTVNAITGWLSSNF